MKLDAGTHLTYIVSHEQWGPAIVPQPEIYVSAIYADGGCAWGFAVREYDLSGGRQGIRAEIFDDAFVAFTQIPEFFQDLVDDEVCTLDAVQALLDRTGALDETRREVPR
jgi:hypothetical protein